MTHDFDLITLGAGSGGIAASRRAAAHGAKVAIVEGSRVGGTCVIRGCVPKKLLVYAAHYGDALREAAGYGWNSLDQVTFDMARWAAAKAAETTRLEGLYRGMLATSGVELIEGWGCLDGPQAVRIGERRLTASHILIATGSTPVRDSVPGIESCATSDELLDLQSLPERMLVLGAGYVAVEFAGALARLGVGVEMVFRGELPLKGFDDDLRRRAATALQAAGVVLHAGATADRVERQDDGSHAVKLHDGRVLSAPFVLNATGRRPCTDRIGLDSVGLSPNDAGAVPVDAMLDTAIPGLHAIGDVTDLKNLTPVAIAQGRALADRLFGPAQPLWPDLEQAATAVFTLPPIGSAGLSEQQARSRGSALKVYETDFRPMRQAFIQGTERSYMKLVVDADSDRVLGIHMIGADAPEIVQSLAVTLSCGATKAQFDRTLAVHPTAAEEFVLMREPARVVAASSARIN